MLQERLNEKSQGSEEVEALKRMMEEKKRVDEEMKKKEEEVEELKKKMSEAKKAMEEEMKNKVVAQTPEMAQTPERPLSSFSPIFMWIGISVRNMFIQSNVLESSRIFQNE